MRRVKPRKAHRLGLAGLSSYGIRASSQGVLVECKVKRCCGGLAGASSDKRPLTPHPPRGQSTLLYQPLTAPACAGVTGTQTWWQDIWT